MEVILVFITVPSKEVARQIGTALIEKQLAACVNIISEVESIYQWEGKVCREEEVLMKVKTIKVRFSELEEFVLAEHPYDNPEIMAVKVERGSEKYLEWVKEQIG